MKVLVVHVKQAEQSKISLAEINDYRKLKGFKKHTLSEFKK